MVFKYLCILVLWTKVPLSIRSVKKSHFLLKVNTICNSAPPTSLMAWAAKQITSVFFRACHKIHSSQAATSTWSAGGGDGIDNQLPVPHLVNIPVPSGSAADVNQLRRAPRERVSNHTNIFYLSNFQSDLKTCDDPYLPGL